MKKTTLFLTCFMICIQVFSQKKVSVDIVQYGNPENIEYNLKNLLTNAIALEESDCITFNILDDLSAATSTYVFEVWDSEEFVSQYIFRQSREKTVKQKDGTEKKQSYLAAGIKARAMYQVAGRLSERESGNVINIFYDGGTMDREISVDEVKKKYKKFDSKHNKALQDKVLIDYENSVEKEREENVKNVEIALHESLTTPILLHILDAPTVSGISKQKKEKVKRINIDFCHPLSPYTYGTFYHPIIMEEEKFGTKVYTEVGTYYGQTGKDDFGVKKGEKEMLPLLKGDAKLVASKPKHVNSILLSKNKNSDAHKVAFLMEYPVINTYTDFEKKYIELLLQSSLLGYKNIMVIANDAITDKLNTTLAGRTEDSDEITTGDALNSKSSKSIWVKIGNKEKPKTVKGNKFLGQKVEKPAAGDRVATMGLTMKHGEESYTQVNALGLSTTKIGVFFKSTYVKMEELIKPLVDPQVEIVEIAEEKKNKIKAVYIKGFERLEKGTKYKVYDKKKVTKKTKSLAELKIKELINNHMALAEVKKGDKKLKELMKKTLTILPSKGGGLLSSDSSKAMFDQNRISRVIVSSNTL